MRLWGLVTVAALIAGPVQAADTVVHTLPPLSIGDHGVIDAHMTIATDNRRDDVARRYEGDMSVEYRVAGSGYRVTLTLKSYAGYDGGDGHRLEGPAEIAMEKMKAATFPITYMADARMRPIRIENWDEVKARLDQAIPEAAHAAAVSDFEVDETQYRDLLTKQYGGLTAETALSQLLGQQGAMAPDFPPMVLDQPRAEPMSVQWHGSTVTGQTLTTLTAWNDASGQARVVTDFQPDARWKAKAVVTIRVNEDIDLRTGLQTRIEMQTASGVKQGGQAFVESSARSIMTVTLRR